jgi:simple sugar transport system permease protein
MILTVLVWAMFARTRAGLILSAVGHNPAKAETIGISPWPFRPSPCWLVAHSPAWVGRHCRSASLDRRFQISWAVAASSSLPQSFFGRWTVLGAAAGAFLMGVLDAVKLNLPQTSDIPIYLLAACRGSSLCSC